MVCANYILIVIAVFLPFFLGVTYLLSVISGHIDPLWPYVSLTGNYPIEACIFSFALNVTAAIFELLVVLRYTQVALVVTVAALDEDRRAKMRNWNWASLGLGTACAAGMSMAGSFQQRNFHFLHLLGFFFCSMGVLGFVLCQAYFSYTIMAPRTHPWVRKYRLFAVIISIIIYMWGPFVVIYNRINQPEEPIKTFSENRQSRKPVYLMSSVFEWFLILLHASFIATLYPDYKKIDLKSDKIIFLD